MKLLHCADLHLEPALSGGMDGEKRKYRRAELLQNFVRMTEYAAEHGADAVLIVGDLFDTENVSKQTQELIRETMRRFLFLDFLYLRGNHDRVDFFEDKDKRPPNLKLFGRDWTYYRYNEVTIAGIEPEGAIAYDRLQLSSEQCNIVLLHGQAVSCGAGENAETICLPELRNKNIDYLALGHIHTYRFDRLDERGGYCYCGCPEGRGFDECGEKGFVWLETDGNRISHSFVPFAKRTVWEVPVDITGAESTIAVEERIFEALEEIPEKDMVRVVLRGTTGIDVEWDMSYLLRRFSPDYFLFDVTDREVRLFVNPEKYKGDISLRGEFVRRVLAGDYPEEEKRKILELGVRALAGEEVESCF